MNIIEKIKEKFKEIFNKTKKKVAIGGTVVALGLTTAYGAKKEADMANNNVKVEQGIDKIENNFKREMKVKENELQTVENQIKALETPEDILKYLKNLYIEKYEKIMGDTDLTTADIALYYTYLEKVYVNNKTGEMIQYGGNYKKVERKLENEGITYKTEDNVKVYQVKDTEGKVIDCVALQDKEKETVPVKVTMNDQFNQPYTSVLAKMGTAIPDGMDYREYMQKGNENDIAISLKQFIESVQELKNANESQNLTEEKTEKNPEGGFQHE